MSYCRFIEGDVYVYMSVSGFLECCACPLNLDSQNFYSTQEMVDHLQEHINTGHHVPADVFVRLYEDDRYNFPQQVIDTWIRHAKLVSADLAVAMYKIQGIRQLISDEDNEDPVGSIREILDGKSGEEDDP